MLAGRARLIAELFNGNSETRHGHTVEQAIERPETIIFEAEPFPVRALRDIGDNSMKMQIGFLISIGIMLKQANSEITGWHRFDLSLFYNSGFCSILLGPCQRCDHSFTICLDNTLITADQCQKRPAFWQRKCEVSTRPMRLVWIADLNSSRQFTAQ